MSSKPKKPAVVAAPDPQIEAQKAADIATQKANSETAARKVRKSQSSLLSSGGARGVAPGGGAGAATETVMAQGKRTLGA